MYTRHKHICKPKTTFWWPGRIGEICPSRHCRRQCKIFANCVNFSIFTLLLYLLSCLLLKLLKIDEIDGVKVLAWKCGNVKFWPNLMSAMAILDLWKTQERLRSSSSNFDKPDCIKAKFFLPKSRSENVNPISVDNLFAHVCIQFVSCCVLWKFVYTQIASHNLLRKTPLLRKSKTRNIDVISLAAQKE